MNDLGSDILLQRRGPYDGRKFLSQSPFRSGRFLTVTMICLVCLILVLYLMFRQRHELPIIVVLSMAGFTIAGIWWRAWRYLDRLRQLYLEGSIKEVATGSPLDIALGVAAGAINDTLFFSFTTIGMLLAIIIRVITK